MITIKAIMIIVVTACGQAGSGGSGCGVSIDHVEFASMSDCQTALTVLFPEPREDAGYAEREDNWQPKREIKCVASGFPL